RERDVVAGLPEQAQVDGPVVRLGALHVGERAHGAAERLLQAELGERDLARRLVDLEVGERPVADAVRLDADTGALQLRELAPVECPVDDSPRREMLVVGERPLRSEIADRGEEHGGEAVPSQDRCGVLEVVEVSVVESDQHGPGRKRLVVEVLRDHVVQRDDRVVELRELRHLLVERARRHRDRVAVDAVDRADAGRGLAEAAVDAVLQRLLELVRTHRGQFMTLPTSARSRSANCSGVWFHSGKQAWAAAPSRSARARSLRTWTSASARASVSSGSTRRPCSPSSTRSRMPPARLATTPRPRANASITTRPRPSYRDGSTSTVDSSSFAATCSGVSRSKYSSARPSIAARCEPRPTTTSFAPGTRGATLLHASASPSTFLYGSSTPTNSAAGCSGSGRGGTENALRSL